jgi:hypothetical protein
LSTRPGKQLNHHVNSGAAAGVDQDLACNGKDTQRCTKNLEITRKAEKTAEDLHELGVPLKEAHGAVSRIDLFNNDKIG